MTEFNENSRLAPSFLPATAVLEMTYKCNHECLFCSCPWEDKSGSFKKEKELSTQQWFKIIDLLCNAGIMNIAFTGGEPLLNKDLSKIIAYAASKNTEHIETVDGKLQSKFAPPNLFLISNGKIADEKTLEMCAKYNVHFSMSLPGLQTFHYHTKNGKPEKVIRLFELAKNYQINTTVNITVTKKNFFELYETIATGLIAGAGSLLMNRFLPGGRGLKYISELMMPREYVVEMLDIAENVLSKSGRKGSIGTELPKCIIPDKEYKYLQVGTQCSAAIDFFVIGPSGYIRTCNHSPINIAHIDNWETVKNQAYWKTFVLKKYLPDHCQDCHLIANCDGGCREAAHIFSGTINAPDPIFVKYE